MASDCTLRSFRSHYLSYFTQTFSLFLHTLSHEVVLLEAMRFFEVLIFLGAIFSGTNVESHIFNGLLH